MTQEIINKKSKLISDLCTISQTSDDFIYGTIQFSRFASELINSSEFQRLRHMKQLGVAWYIFPNAVHTRFEHSLGTYFQCKELTKRLADVTPDKEMNEYLRAIPELSDYIEKNYGDKKCDFDKYLQELVNVGSLLHDIGHGPFSHLFDDVFINDTELKAHENALHEKRSQLLVNIIIKKSPYLSVRISDDHIKFIQDVIDPPKHVKGFLYQIVSNYNNSLDVDKFDYITRDMKMIGKHSSFDYKKLLTQAVITNNTIAFPNDCAFDILQLFNMRHTMHRCVYNHTGVVNLQLMIRDLMKKINKILNISESIKDMNRFCKFTDSFIMQYPEFLDVCMLNNPNESIDVATAINFENKNTINEIITLSQKIKTQKFYHLIFAFVLEKKITFNKEEIFKDGFEQYLDDIIVYTSAAGFVSGDKPNPLDNIYLYDYNNIKYSNEKVQYVGNTIQKSKHGITNLISNNYQEYLTMIYFKKNDDNNKIIQKLEEHFQNYISSYLQHYVIKYIKIEK